jgi:hypothetical protein
MTNTNTPTANPRLRAVRIEASDEARNYISGTQRITMVPLTIRRRHNRKLLVAPPESESTISTGGPDVPMIKTLGKAFYWQQQIDEGTVSPK